MLSSTATWTCSATAAYREERWVGAYPGQQMMVVRLTNTGTLVLTGDNVYFRENVEKHLPPNMVLAYYPAGIMRAYEFIRSRWPPRRRTFSPRTIRTPSRR